MIGWQESLTTIVKVLVHIFVLTSTKVAPVECGATEASVRVSTSSWVHSTFVIHIAFKFF